MKLVLNIFEFFTRLNSNSERGWVKSQGSKINSFFLKEKLLVLTDPIWESQINTKFKHSSYYIWVITLVVLFG